jgi:hypothetical protein
MTSIDKATIPISKAALVVVFVGGLIAHYYTTLNAVRQGISDLKSDMQLEIQALKTEDIMLKSDMAHLQLAANDMRMDMMSFISDGIKPEEPTRSYTDPKKRKR